MSFREYLREVLDKPYKWKWGLDKEFATFTTRVGDIYTIDFYESYTDDDNTIFDITFSRNKDKDSDIDMSITGTGDSFRVFATVKEVIKDFLNYIKKRDDFKAIMYSAKEKSRIRLYDTLSKKLVNDTYLTGYKKIRVHDFVLWRGQKPKNLNKYLGYFNM